MKKWEIPAIEALDITNTAWNTLQGDEPDNMYQDCDPLYYEVS